VAKPCILFPAVSHRKQGTYFKAFFRRVSPFETGLPIPYVQKMNKTFYLMLSEHTSKEFSILSYIEQNSDATQRELSEHVGVSLGMVNILMKRLVKKGLVKIERLQPNSVKYFLTPAGIANKLERTYGYIVRTYRELISLQQQLYSEIAKNQKLYSNRDFCLYGPSDEIYTIIEGLQENNLVSGDLQYISTTQQLQDIGAKESIVAFVWRQEDAEVLLQAGCKTVNLLESLSWNQTQGTM
jgi:DNA-binding MarR family transcriptional regulator